MEKSLTFVSQTNYQHLIFSHNYIDGQEFLSLFENNIKSMVPPLGLARKIFRIVQSTQVYLCKII